MVKGFDAKKGETTKQYLARLHLGQKTAGLDAEDKSVIEAFAMYWWDDVLVDVIAAKEKRKQEAAAEAARARRFAPVRNAGFTTMAADVAAGFYVVTRTAAADTKTRNPTAEKQFAESYASDSTVALAAEDAIANLDVTASNSQKYARHDFQPGSARIVNLQVQLGGTAGSFRRGKGDSSTTLVVIDARLWDDMMVADPARWRLVIQAAHRESLRDGTGVYLSPGSL